MNLVIASRNKGKISEIKELLADLPIEVLSLLDYPLMIEIEENGETFAENAQIKAQAVYNCTKCAVLADDSGLEIDALDGRPGVHSSRFAGENAADAEKCELILNMMKNVPDEKRTARFKSVICIIDMNGSISLTEGVCNGIITHEPIGDNGFGYDPIFYIPNLNRTMAQLTSSEKNAVSHRGIALRLAVDIIKKL